MPQRIGNVELYMGPKQVGGPDDLQQAIIKFIKGAKKRLESVEHKVRETAVSR